MADLNLKNMSMKEIYARMKESGNSDDFPHLITNNVHNILIDSYRGVPKAWDKFAFATSVSDFKPHNRIMMSESENLLTLAKNEPVKDSCLIDESYPLTAQTWERKFSITREALINDDTDTLVRTAQRLGRAAARTLHTTVSFMLDNGAIGHAYDAVDFFEAGAWPAGHLNYANVALTADITGANAVLAGMVVIQGQTDIAGRAILGLTPKYLIVPPALQGIANALCHSQTILNAALTVMTYNPINGLLIPVVDHHLISGTVWYVGCEPSEAIGIEVGFLNGKQEPDVLQKQINAITPAGTTADGDFDFETIEWKARLDFGVAYGDPRALYRGVT